MYICSFCSKNFKSILTTKKHIFSAHCYDHNCKIVCNIDGCSEKLNNKLCLRKHIYKNHRGKKWIMPRSWYCLSSLHVVDNDRVGPTFGSSSNISNDCSSSNLFDVSYHNDAPVQLGLDQTNEQHAIEISTLELDDECNQSQSCYGTSNNEYDDIYSSENDDTESNDPDIDILTYHQTLKNLGQQKQLMAISLSKLKADGNLTETSLQTIQEWAEGLIEESVRTVIGGVKLYCKEISTKLNEVFLLGLGLCNPFHGIKHEVQRKKCLPYFVVSRLGYIQIYLMYSIAYRHRVFRCIPKSTNVVPVINCKC